jgi:hypothetical protein
VQYEGLFADFEILGTNGSAGEKEYIWFEFPGMTMASQLRYRWGDGPREHNIRLDLDWKRQATDESVLEKVSVNGITTVLNHGSNRILSKSSWHIAPEYEVLHEVMDMRVGMDFGMHEGVASQVYPYVYAQSLKDLAAYLELVFHYGRFDLGAKGTYGTGWLSESERMASSESGVQSVPVRLQDWYDRQMEYRTATRFRAEIMLRYSFLNGLYLEADLVSTKAYRLKHIDDPQRFAATLKFGYNF